MNTMQPYTEDWLEIWRTEAGSEYPTHPYKHYKKDNSRSLKRAIEARDVYQSRTDNYDKLRPGGQKRDVKFNIRHVEIRGALARAEKEEYASAEYTHYVLQRVYKYPDGNISWSDIATDGQAKDEETDEKVVARLYALVKKEERKLPGTVNDIRYRIIKKRAITIVSPVATIDITRSCKPAEINEPK
jgi:hypothetical protein